MDGDEYGYIISKPEPTRIPVPLPTFIENIIIMFIMMLVFRFYDVLIDAFGK